jgi:hypothetical protein
MTPKTCCRRCLLEIPFKRMSLRNPPFDTDEKRLELLQRLNKIPRVNLPDDGINRYPTFSLLALRDDENLREFLRIIDWSSQEVRSAAEINQ